MNLRREREHRWIFQKNVSSSTIIKAFVRVLNEERANVDYGGIQQALRDQNIYRGRDSNGSLSTMGVRFSQMCFYMFGYRAKDTKKHKTFVPSPMTLVTLKEKEKCDKKINEIRDEQGKTDEKKEKEILEVENERDRRLQRCSLVNLYSMQFPHPYSRTPEDFKIYIGRLIVKLLLDERIEKRLYIDEMIWFLPFIETIDDHTYEELIKDICDYRKLTYEQKLEKFESVRNFNDVFANVTHEINYYFLKIFKGFNVFEIKKDDSHNGGKIFKFRHGNEDTYRTDAYDSRKTVSGYVTLNENLINDAIKLNENFSAFSKPTTMETEDIYSREDWLTAIYDTEPLSYLNCIEESVSNETEVYNVIQTMIHASKYGSHDGSEFENSLKPFLELFGEMINVEIIGGAGNTDLLCALNDNNEHIYKMNVEAKTRNNGLEQINSQRLENHMRMNHSAFCVVIAPRFARGVSGDIRGHRIVTIRAEDFGTYCYKECLNKESGLADFEPIHEIIEQNYGTDITDLVRELTASRYGLSLPNTKEANVKHL